MTFAVSTISRLVYPKPEVTDVSNSKFAQVAKQCILRIVGIARTLKSLFHDNLNLEQYFTWAD